MKKIIIRIVVVIILVLLVALTVVFLSLNTIVKKGVETVGPSLTKVEVRLASADISPFSGSGKLSGLFVGNPEGYKTPSAIQVGSIRVAVEIGSALSDTIVIDDVTVQSPEITLEGTVNGNNLTQILNNLSGGGTAAQQTATAPAAANTPGTASTPAPAPAPKKEKKFILRNFLIDGGKINLSLNIPGLAGTSATAPLPPIHLQDIGVAEGGVTANQLALAIAKPLLAGVTKAAETAVGGMAGQLNNLGKQGASQATQIGKSLGDLFKK
jgi:hypothetical protein